MKCSFLPDRFDSIKQCLQAKGIIFLSNEELRAHVDTLTTFTKNKVLSSGKYFHVYHARELSCIYWGLILTAIAGVSIIATNRNEWLFLLLYSDEFQFVGSAFFWIVLLVFCVFVVTLMREYLKGRGFIRKWRYTKWWLIDDWQEIQMRGNAPIPQSARHYLEELSDNTRDLSIRIQYTKDDGKNAAGAFLIFHDRTYETYYALFWH